MSKPIDAARLGAPAPLRDIAAPQPLESCPFRHPITVGWGDCDPAQIAYTANIPSWGLQAIEAWYKACLGVDWYALNLDHGLGTPFVALSFDFKAPVTPRAPLICTVYIERIGRSSLSHLVEGRQEDRLCFLGQTTAAFVEAARMKPCAIPANARQAIESYRARQGRPPAAGR